MLSTVGFGAVGFADDYLKITRATPQGLSVRMKLFAQSIVAFAVGLALIELSQNNLYNTDIIFPFFKEFTPNIGWLYVPFAMLVLVMASNAVNLTDGLDGDVGSLALGGALGTVALLIKQELLLPIIGAVFLIEMLSVVIQVGSFKLTGQRVFKMAPIHHHFELVGWSEPKIISRFLIAAVVFALFNLATLKLR